MGDDDRYYYGQRDLGDGQSLYVLKLIGGRARLVIGRSSGATYDDAW